MESAELRDPDQARRYLASGLALMRADRPSPAHADRALRVALEGALAGDPLLPTGVLADLAHVVGGDLGRRAGKEALPDVPGWPHAAARSYEDTIVGRFYADPMVERAADALRRYRGRDQFRGLAFLAKTLRERLGVPGVEVPPAAIRSMLGKLPAEWPVDDDPEEAVALAVGQVEALVRGMRRVGDWLGPDDVAAIEQRTVLAEMGQFVAHRQILRTVALLESAMPARAVRPRPGRREVPTRVLDEDQYPVGGYTSISTKGTLESLLHSQLAYMEPDGGPGDLFDLKLARDELFYYSRDENQFLRRRRAFVLLLEPDLVATRFKDAGLPVQRIVLALALVIVLVRKLSEWLSSDALRFDLVLTGPAAKHPLAAEAELLARLLREPIERGDVALHHRPDHAAAEALAKSLAAHHQLHALHLTADPANRWESAAVVARLVVAGERPALFDGRGDQLGLPADEPVEAWGEAVEALLTLWV